jgi:hypothetical protein
MDVVEEIAITEMGEEVTVVEGSSSHVCSDCGGPMLPAALESESGSEIPLRCFVRQAGKDLFIAECIDLDISAESGSLKGAVNGLRDAIIGYLMVVLDGVETDQEAPAAILRPAPLSHRVRYHWEYVKYKIGALFGGYHHYKRKFYEAPYGSGNQHCHV